MANNRFIRHIKIEANEQGEAPKTLQLLHVGSWNTPWHGDFETTEGDIHEYVEHFEQGVGLPEDNDGKAQINFGHKAHEEAAGWMHSLRAEQVEGVLSVVADVDWTDDAAAAIKAGKWRYISPEFNPRALPWEDPEEEWRMVANVITGAGLTNIPLFKKLKKVAASERPEPSGSNKRNQGEPMKFKLEEVRQKEASAINADERAFLESNKSELSAEELTKFDIKADDKKPAKVEGDAKAVTIDASELAQLQAAAAQGVEAAQKLAQKEASDFADGVIAAGQVKSEEKEALTKILLASSGDQRTALEEFLSGLPKNQKLGDELGDSGKDLSTSAHDELNAKVVEKITADVEAGKPKPSYADIRASVLAGDADLAKRIKDEEEN